MNLQNHNSIMSREEHNKMAMIENLIWAIAKIMIPNSYIDPAIIATIKNTIVTDLCKKNNCK